MYKSGSAKQLAMMNYMFVIRKRKTFFHVLPILWHLVRYLRVQITRIIFMDLNFQLTVHHVFKSST